MVLADAGEPEAAPLVPHVHAVLGVVDGVEPDHALVHVGAGVVHRVVVEPEEALLLPVVAGGRPVQVQVVDGSPRVVAPVTGPGPQGVVRVAVTLRRGVAVVQVSQEAASVLSEVLPVQAERVLVQVVLEADQGRPAVLGVDHRAREGAVEAVDRAERQGPLDAGRHATARLVEGDGGFAVGVDGQNLRRGERVAAHPEVDLVDKGVRVPDFGWPDLVPVVPQGVLLAQSGSGRLPPGAEVDLGHRSEGLRDRQRVAEGVENQRTGGKVLDVEQQVTERGGRGRERAVGRPEPLLGEVRLPEGPGGGQCDPGRTYGAGPQEQASGEPLDPVRQW